VGRAAVRAEQNALRVYMLSAGMTYADIAEDFIGRYRFRRRPAFRHRTLNIPVRHGHAAHTHPLAKHGGPDAFPPHVWAALAGRGAEQRIRRLIAIPGHAHLRHAAQTMLVLLLAQTLSAALLAAAAASLLTSRRLVTPASWTCAVS
jgi:hypothetical protein